MDGPRTSPGLLVVERDEAFGERVRTILERDVGATVATAASAREALDALAAGAGAGAGIDAMITALDLPDMSAFGLCRRVRQDPTLAELPIIVVSELDDEDVLAGLFDAGASELLLRPLRPVELVARARTALRTAKLRRDAGELLELACVDPLTGLANRRHTEALVRAAWQQAARAGRPLSLVLVDLDHFHAFNERHGHRAGDEALRRVASVLAGTLRRPGDVVGRWGGEELLVLLPETDAGGARLVAERLRAAVERLAVAHGGAGAGAVLTASLGLAARVPGAGTSPEDLLDEADAALYRAKAAGRNAVSGDVETGRILRSGVSGAARWPEPVVIDPVHAERIPALLQARVLDLCRVAAAVDAGDFERLRFVAREMRAIAARHGFATDEAGRQLERAASARDADAARTIAEELAWYLAHVPVVYRRRTDRLAGA